MFTREFLYTFLAWTFVFAIFMGEYAFAIGLVVMFPAIVILLDAARYLDNWLARRNVAKAKRRAL